MARRSAGGRRRWRTTRVRGPLRADGRCRRDEIYRRPRDQIRRHTVSVARGTGRPRARIESAPPLGGPNTAQWYLTRRDDCLDDLARRLFYVPRLDVATSNPTFTGPRLRVRSRRSDRFGRRPRRAADPIPLTRAADNRSCSGAAAPRKASARRRRLAYSTSPVELPDTVSGGLRGGVTRRCPPERLA